MVEGIKGVQSDLWRTPLMSKEEDGRIVETAREARGAERGPTVRNVLVWSTGLVMVGFVAVYMLYF
jgi:hypothetical protein